MNQSIKNNEESVWEFQRKNGEWVTAEDRDTATYRASANTGLIRHCLKVTTVNIARSEVNVGYTMWVTEKVTL